MAGGANFIGDGLQDGWTPAEKAVLEEEDIIMKQKRAERIMEALKEMGLRQMLIVDPMSIYYLTGVCGAI